MNSQQLVWNAFGSYVRNAHPVGSQAQEDTTTWFQDLYTRRDVINVQVFHAERTYNGTTKTVGGFCLNQQIFVSTEAFVLSLPTPTPLPGIERADKLVGMWLRARPVPSEEVNQYIRIQTAPFVNASVPRLYAQPSYLGGSSYMGTPDEPPHHSQIDIEHSDVQEHPYMRALYQGNKDVVTRFHAAGIGHCNPDTVYGLLHFAAENPRVNRLHYDAKNNSTTDQYSAMRMLNHAITGAGTGYSTTKDDKVIIECPLYATSAHLGFSTPRDSPIKYAPQDLGSKHKATGNKNGRAILLTKTGYELYRPDLPTAHPWNIKFG